MSTRSLLIRLKELKNSFIAFIMESSRKDKTVVFALLVLFGLIFCAIFADLIAPKPYWAIDLSNRLLPPSWEHPFGTDHLGRDILSRIIYGARLIIYSISLVLVISTSIGLMLGLISGYYSGIIDLIFTRIIDIILCFPPIILSFGILAVIGIGLENAIISASICYVAPVARLVRGQVLSAKESLYVENARMIGCSNIRIIFRHILPNIVSPIIVQITLNAAGITLLMGALGFIGLGSQPPTPDWGVMMYDARPYLNVAFHPIFFIGLAIFVTSFSFNVIGEALRDYLDVRERTL